MAVFTRIKTWVSNEVLTASDLNGEFNNLLNNTIPASIEDYSTDVATMQSTADPGGVGTESLATTLAGEIQRLRFAIKRLAGGAQWYVAPAFNLTTPLATAAIADGAITKPKLEALGQQVSASCGAFATTSGTYVAVTNLAVTITTTGRPIVLKLISDATVGDSSISVANGTAPADVTAYLGINENAGAVFEQYKFGMVGAAAAAGITIHGSAVEFFLPKAAGVYTYQVFAKVSSSAGINASTSVTALKLLAYEIM